MDGPEGLTSAETARAALSPETEYFVDLIDDSMLFDELYYQNVAGISAERRRLILHYIERGETELLNPSKDFDVAFYRHTNPDVVASGMSPLMHYLRHGRSEGRYPNRKRLRQDAARIERSGIFGQSALLRGLGSPKLGLSDIEYYLAVRGADKPPLCTPEFDSSFYWSAYPDVREYSGDPLLHYINIGTAEDRVCTEAQLRERKQRIAEHFDSAYYLSQFPSDERPEDPLEHYVLHGVRLSRDPSPDFCADYYGRRYPDLQGVNLFEHFVFHGREEGRVGRPDFSSCLTRGKRAFDLRKPTILIANHEASRTGAPLLGYMVQSRLAEEHNVIVSLRRSGALESSFLESSCLAAVGVTSELDAEYLLRELKRNYLLEAVVLNSVETDNFAAAALHAGVPSVALIHEFAEYTLPAGRMSRVVESADRVVVPANLVSESISGELQFTRGGIPNNVTVQPQGYLPRLPQDDALRDLGEGEILSMIGVHKRSEAQIVLGAGHVHIRKGVDLFVQTAAEVRRLSDRDNIHFVWVGGGYDPKRDPHYCLWIADMVKRLDLDGVVHFLPPQGCLDLLFDLASVFYLPSRLDPFPNVALDAFQSRRPVVCFQRATGIAEHLLSGHAPGKAVNYCNVREAAQAIVDIIESPPAPESFGDDLSRFFSFERYVEFLKEEIRSAIDVRNDLVGAAEEIRARGVFDAAFHNGVASTSKGEVWRATLDYVARGRKGLSYNNPRPGFSDNFYYSSRDIDRTNAASSALELALGEASELTSPSTHRCVTLTGEAPAHRLTPRIGLHLHLHYADLIEEFIDQIVRADCRADLIVTTTSAEKRLEIYYALRKHRLGTVHVLEVENRGRDIGPLLTVLKPLLAGERYDLIGHLHGKRSVDLGGNSGNHWRKYLLGTLLGDEANYQEILGLFDDDRTLGLVFPEDRHSVGWGDNVEIARELAQRLQPSPVLPQYPTFALGTMFWARPAVLQPLWDLELEAADLPSEPVPYDGTVLHALERLLPSVCESTRHTWCTVYREGRAW